MFINHRPMIKELSNQIDKISQCLHHKVDQLKEMKMKEISNIFEGFSSNINNLRQWNEKGRNEQKNYYHKHKKFFNFPQT